MDVKKLLLKTTVPEAERVTSALRAFSAMRDTELESTAKTLVGQLPEFSWFYKPVEIAALIEQVKRRSRPNSELVNRCFYTVDDFSVLDVFTTSCGPLQANIAAQVFDRGLRDPVYFLSSKFNDFVSSQEYVRDILLLLKEKIDVVLFSDREFSDFYKQKFNCIKISEPAEFDEYLVHAPPSLVVDISGNHEALCSRVKKPNLVVDPWGLPSFGLRNFAAQLAQYGIRKYHKFLVNPFESVREPLMFIPSESNIRQYPEIAPEEIPGGPVVLGAFCRTAKLNIRVIREWASVLRRHKNCELWFAFIQSNVGSESLTKIVFEELGVSANRVRFLPRMPTYQYLATLNRVHISFSGMPEQGGISSMDALLMGCPHLVCDELSNTFGASDFLEELGLGAWRAETVDRFHSIVDDLLRDSRALMDIDMRRLCRNRLLASSLGRPERTANEWLRFFEATYPVR